MINPLRVLLVEDSATDADFIVRALRRAGYSVEAERVDSRAAMDQALTRGGWDVILTDYSLPQFGGLEALGLYQHYGLDIPFLVVSGAIAQDTAVQMMKAGAHDFVMKDDLARLGPAIQRELRETSVRRERRHAEQALRESEHRLRSLADAAFEGIAIAEQGLLVDANDQLAALLGFSREELLGKPVLELVAPESRSTVIQAVDSNWLEPYEHLALRKDGSTVPVEVRARVLTVGGRKLRVTAIRDITERKQAEQAIQAILKGTAAAVGEAFFKSLVVELAAALHVRFAFVARLSAASPPRARTIARARDGVILDDIEYDLRGTPSAVVIEQAVGFFPRDLQRRFPGDGPLRLMGVESFLGVPLVAASGKPLGLVAVMNDRPLSETQFAKDVLAIFAARAAVELERLEAEAALRESEAKYRLIADNMSDTLWLAGLDLRLSYVSPSVERASGYAWNELEGRPLAEMLAAASLDRAAALAAELLALEPQAPLGPDASRTVELEYRRRDGATYWAEVTLTLLRDSAGLPTSFLGVGRNIDERRRAEADRAAYTAEIAALYRASGALMSPGNDPASLAEQIARTLTQEFAFADCGVLLVDEAAAELIRVARAGRFDIRPTAKLSLSGPGLTVAAFHSGQSVYAPDVMADPRYAANNVTTRSELAIPLRVPGAEGRVIGVLDLQSPEPEAFDERARRIVSAYAERAALALENARLVASLEQAVQRANELAIAAEESNRLKSEFLANTSHELRTPLTAILGSLGLVLDEHYDSPDEERQFLSIATASARNLLSVVNDLLDTAKIEAGRMELDLQPLDPAPIILQVLETFSGQAEAKSVTLAAETVEAMPPVCGDPDMLRRILTNLIGNALKFTEQGSVTVRARLSPGADRVLIQVEDTGIGIALDKQPALFQPFVQADGSSTRRYGGTGLGLSISRRLAEMMGGTLTLASAGAGQGSLLTLSLPVAVHTPEN